MEIIFFIGRLLFGGFFLMSGINHFKNHQMLSGYAGSKGLPSPLLAVYGSGLLILLGGLGVILGIYPTISLWLIVIFLLPVTFAMHNFWKDTDPNMKMNNEINFKKNMALLGAALMAIYLSQMIPWTSVLF